MKRLLMGLLAAALLCPAGAAGAYERHAVVAGALGTSVTLVRLALSRYRLGVALAGPRVGDNAFLLDIARRARARCAINGTFLAAYTAETGEPYGTLVVDGRLIHLGSVGTRLDVFADGSAHLVRDGLEIRGALDGSYAYPHNWYAYNVNQTPTPGGSSAYLFTQERGATLGFHAGLAVVARAGRVVRTIRGQDSSIPPGGFVLALQGKEVAVQGWKFGVGKRIAYRAVQNGAPLQSRYSLGAGPRLIQGGRVSVNPAAEGFREAKILSLRQTRSAVGFTHGGEVILAVIDRATVGEAALIMKTLGAVEAMNLDGGASSGLVCDGTYMFRPGRKVANALVLWAVSR